MKRLLNTKGSAAYLGCSENWVHKLVSSGKLKAYIYDESGALIERPPGAKRQGASLNFYQADLTKLKTQRGKRTRPAQRRRQYTDEQRARALQLVSEGMSHRKAAQQVGVSYQAVNNWMKEENRSTESEDANE